MMTIFKYKAKALNTDRWVYGSYFQMPKVSLCCVNGSSDKEWDCPKCHTHHYRDQNAGINLREYGLNKLLSGKELPEVPVEMSTLVESMKQEAICFS